MSSSGKYVTGTRQTRHLRADVATHMDMFIQKNTVQTPINDLWPEFSSTINLLQTKYVPSKLHLKDLLMHGPQKLAKAKLEKRSCI